MSWQSSRRTNPLEGSGRTTTRGIYPERSCRRATLRLRRAVRESSVGRMEGVVVPGRFFAKKTKPRRAVRNAPGFPLNSPVDPQRPEVRAAGTGVLAHGAQPRRHAARAATEHSNDHGNAMIRAIRGTQPVPPPKTMNGVMLRATLLGRRVNIRQLVYTSLEAAANKMRTILGGIWADSTMSKRQALMQRWERFCDAMSLPRNQHTAVLFTSALPSISKQTQLQYLKELSSIFGVMGWERQEIQLTIKALVAQGAAIPERQAVPISKEHVMAMRAEVRDNPRLELSILLMWKTASRWDDVLQLTKEDFIVVTPQEVIVHWSHIKGWRANPWRPSMYTVIVGDLTPYIAYQIAQLPAGKFCPWSVTTFDHKVKRFHDPALHVYTGHSFKRGASCHVIKEIQRTKAAVAPHELSIFLKHSLMYDLLSSTDLRYFEAGPEMARWLGTQKISNLL